MILGIHWPQGHLQHINTEALYRATLQSEIDTLAQEYNLYEGRNFTLENLQAAAIIHYKINALMTKIENLIYPKLNRYTCNERFKIVINERPRRPDSRP